MPWSPLLCYHAHAPPEPSHVRPPAAAAAESKAKANPDKVMLDHGDRSNNSRRGGEWHAAIPALMQLRIVTAQTSLLLGLRPNRSLPIQTIAEVHEASCLHCAGLGVHQREEQPACARCSLPVRVAACLHLCWVSPPHGAVQLGCHAGVVCPAFLPLTPPMRL